MKIPYISIEMAWIINFVSVFLGVLVMALIQYKLNYKTWALLLVFMVGALAGMFSLFASFLSLK